VGYAQTGNLDALIATVAAKCATGPEYASLLSLIVRQT